MSPLKPKITPAEKRQRQRARDIVRDSEPTRHDYNKNRATAFRETDAGRTYFSVYRQRNRGAARVKAALRPAVFKRALASLLI